MAELFEFAPEVIRARFIDHWVLADDFLEGLELEYGIKTGLDVRRLYLVIVSCYKDIERFKNFHLNDPFSQKSDAIKRASYLSKWFCRFKPIYVVGSEANILDQLGDIGIDKSTLVNEMFAIYVASIHLSSDIKRPFLIGAEKGHELAYEMLYRHLSEDSFMLFYQLLLDQLRNKEVVVFY